MQTAALIKALSTVMPAELASEIVKDFADLRTDLSTRTLGRASPGKFVEVFVQVLQFLGKGTYEKKPNVDKFLNSDLEALTAVPEGLRLCGGRIARSIYTLRNKRNIAHKGEVDPNTADLAFCHSAASWIISELLRHASGLTMQEAGELIALVHVPVGTLVEEIDGTAIVLGDVSVRTEILLLLHSRYPSGMAVSEVLKSLSRRSPGTVKNRLRDLHNEKTAQGDAKAGYRLTQKGYDAAVAEIKALRGAV